MWIKGILLIEIKTFSPTMKGEVPKMGLKMITSNNYEDNVVLSVEPVVINLWAKWSPLCDKVGEILNQIAEEYDGYVRVVQMNLEQQPELTELFEVDKLPLVLMMTGGVICKKIIRRTYKAGIYRRA